MVSMGHSVPTITCVPCAWSRIPQGACAQAHRAFLIGVQRLCIGRHGQNPLLFECHEDDVPSLPSYTSTMMGTTIGSRSSFRSKYR